MFHGTTLFAAPKQGGILQSSGFLDLKSLWSLSLTAKAHAYDELSLILLIEHEITRNHQVMTVEEAIAFWRTVCMKPRLKLWLERDNDRRKITTTTTTTTADCHENHRALLREAVCYEVMFYKMLRVVEVSERLRVVSENGKSSMSLLHHAASLGALDCMKTILSLSYPSSESEHLQAMNMRDKQGRTVLHSAAISGNIDCITFVLDLHPESTRLQSVRELDRFGMTVLHCVAISGNVASFEAILALHSTESEHLLSQVLKTESLYGITVVHHAAQSGSHELIRAILENYVETEERIQIVNRPDHGGRTVLHHTASSGNTESIKLVLSVYRTELERFQALRVQDRDGRTVWHHALDSRNPAAIEYTLSVVSEPQRLYALGMKDSSERTLLHCASLWRKNQVECTRTVLAFYPESQRLQALNVRDLEQKTVWQRMTEETRDSIKELLPANV